MVLMHLIVIFKFKALTKSVKGYKIISYGSRADTMTCRASLNLIKSVKLDFYKQLERYLGELRHRLWLLRTAAIAK